MRITVEYSAQVKRAAGVASEAFEVEPDCTVQALLERACGVHGDDLRRLLFHGDGNLHPSILVFVGDVQVRGDAPLELAEGDTVTVLSPISGG